MFPSVLCGTTICSAVVAGAVSSARDLALVAMELCQAAAQPHWWHLQLALYGVPNRDTAVRSQVKNFLREAGRAYRDGNLSEAMVLANKGLAYDPGDPGCNRVISSCADTLSNPFHRSTVLDKLMEEIGWQCLTRVTTNPQLEGTLKTVVPGFAEMTQEQRRRSAFLGLLFQNWLPQCASMGNDFRVVPIEKSISSAKRTLGSSRDSAHGAAMGGRTLHSVRAVSGGPRAPTFVGEEVWVDSGHGAWVHEFAHLAHYAMEKSRDAGSKALAALIKETFQNACRRDQRMLPNAYAAVNHYEFFAEVMRIAIRREPLAADVQRIATRVIELSGLSDAVKQRLLM